MNSTSVALAAILVLGSFCSGCDRGSSQTSDAASSDSKEMPWTAPWDCVTEAVKKQFDPTSTEIELARKAVKSCEEAIAKGERLQGIERRSPPPDFEELLVARAASGAEAEELKRLNRFRIETWQIARKVASDLLSYNKAHAQGSLAASAAASASK